MPSAGPGGDPLDPLYPPGARGKPLGSPGPRRGPCRSWALLRASACSAGSVGDLDEGQPSNSRAFSRTGDSPRTPAKAPPIRSLVLAGSGSLKGAFTYCLRRQLSAGPGDTPGPQCRLRLSPHSRGLQPDSSRRVCLPAGPPEARAAVALDPSTVPPGASSRVRGLSPLKPLFPAQAPRPPVAGGWIPLDPLISLRGSSGGGFQPDQGETLDPNSGTLAAPLLPEFPSGGPLPAGEALAGAGLSLALRCKQRLRSGSSMGDFPPYPLALRGPGGSPWTPKHSVARFARASLKLPRASTLR